jgi:hypothetical protein
MKIRRIDVAIVALSVLAAVGFWSRNILIIGLAIPAGIYIIKHKAGSEAEKERREALSIKSLAVSLVIPVIIVFSLTVYLLIKLVPVIIHNWNP